MYVQVDLAYYYTHAHEMLIQTHTVYHCGKIVRNFCWLNTVCVLMRLQMVQPAWDQGNREKSYSRSKSDATAAETISLARTIQAINSPAWSSSSMKLLTRAVAVGYFSSSRARRKETSTHTNGASETRLSKAMLAVRHRPAHNGGGESQKQ